VPLCIGIDEAGLGPNLGPLVVTVTAWEIPTSPHQFDFWSGMCEVISRELTKGDGRLHIADSKLVYSPARGLAPLERSARAALQLGHYDVPTFRELCEKLSPLGCVDALDVPWYAEHESLPLPVHPLAAAESQVGERWRRCCEQAGIRLIGLRSDVVSPARLNRLTREADSKGRALSRITLRLLRSLWDPDDEQETLIISDKHGGRNRYDELLDEVLDGQMIFRVEEGAELSRYRVGRSELRFQTRGEAHFPVAVASILSKYLRELAMLLFNRFWQREIPGLRPTAGYPQDARRFLAEIAPARQRLAIPDDVLWRAR